MARFILDGDNDLDEYIKNLVQNEFRHQIQVILKHQLEGIVAGELAKMRLNGANGSIGDIVNSAIDARITDRLDLDFAAHFRVNMRSYLQNELTRI